MSKQVIPSIKLLTSGEKKFQRRSTLRYPKQGLQVVKPINKQLCLIKKAKSSSQEKMDVNQQNPVSQQKEVNSYKFSLQHMEPRTLMSTSRYESHRVQFNRRRSHTSKQILIIHLQGVIGDLVLLNQKSGKHEESFEEILLRYEAIYGLLELSKSYQVVLYSGYSENLTLNILEFFQSHKIAFDGVYTKHNQENSSEFSIYTQIYIDFEVAQVTRFNQTPGSDMIDLDSSNLQIEYTDRIEREVLIISAIGLDNQGIQASSDKKSFDGLQGSYNQNVENVDFTDLYKPMTRAQQYLDTNQKLNFDGLPIDSDKYVPLVLLVPHLRAQTANISVSFVQILNLIKKLQVLSYFRREEIFKEYNKSYLHDKIKMTQILEKEQCSADQFNSGASPHGQSPSKISEQITQERSNQACRGKFQVMAIQPQNIYKKILSQCNDKVLDRTTCNILNSYYVVKKHILFDCKSAISIQLQPQLKLRKQSQDKVIILRQQLKHLEHYKETMGKINSNKIVPESTKKPMTEIQQQFYDLMMENNQTTKQEIQKHNMYHNKAVQKIFKEYQHLVRNYKQQQNSGKSSDTTNSHSKERGSDSSGKTPSSKVQNGESFGDFVNSQQKQKMNDLTTIIEHIQERIENEIKPDLDPDQQPIHRFLILQGNKFQNYKSEIKQRIRRSSRVNVFSNDLCVRPLVKKKQSMKLAQLQQIAQNYHGQDHMETQKKPSNGSAAYQQITQNLGKSIRKQVGRIMSNNSNNKGFVKPEHISQNERSPGSLSSVSNNKNHNQISQSNFRGAISPQSSFKRQNY